MICLATPKRLSGWLGVASAGALGRWIEEDVGAASEDQPANPTSRRSARSCPAGEKSGAHIAAVVDNWDTATLVNRLELQVGRDLQYIRINGTLVGGLVGVLIFTLSRALGQ